MSSHYIDLAERVGKMIAEAMLEHEKTWTGAESPDRLVADVLIMCGLVAVRLVLTALGVRFEEEARARGYTGERRDHVSWLCLYGMVEVVSIYMRKNGDKEGIRPMKDQLGIVGGGKSRAVERALSDFGIDESFGAAALKFKEHYGVDIHRTTIRRTTLRIASEAASFIESKMVKPAEDEPPHQLLIEADGSFAPIATLEPVPGEFTAKGRPKKKKHCTFREVRLGLAVPDDSDSPTYVARVGDIETFATSLARAARYRGAEEAEHVYAVTDGGGGLRERLEGAVHIDQYILDKRHCESHLLETATEMGCPDPGAKADGWMGQLARGDGAEVRAELSRYADNADAPGATRARRLHDHLDRFSDATSYSTFREKFMVIGSGEAESAHRHVTQRRLKIAGAWWAERNLDPIACLRALRANGWWDEFWRTAA
jgi:hypothetical protein